jgi:hypothetical protein
MQCKDIPDSVFIDAVRATRSLGRIWRMSWEVHAELESRVGEVPWTLLLAKARKLIARGLLGGCYCGCRGDWHPSDECDNPQCCKPSG